MSGDVQPRKRKDKKRKKDDAGHDEPRYESHGTASVLGEGDVFMHSYHDHGTGGHWCAKIIFFSLLAILITLIGLIILENRGLSDLEANSVESRYSGVLEGWLEDVPDDDHHDIHTLELTHHDDDEDDHGDDNHERDEDDHGDDSHELDEGYGDSEDDEHDQDNGLDDHDNYQDDHDERDENESQDDEMDSEDRQELKMNEDIEEEEEGYFSKLLAALNAAKSDVVDNDENLDDDEHPDETNEDEKGDIDATYDTSKEFNDVEERSIENTYDNSNNNDDQDDIEENQDMDRSIETNNNEHETETRVDEQKFFNGDAYSKYDKEDEDEHDDDDDHEEDEVEVERIEREALENEEPISTELPPLPEADDDDNDKADDGGDGDESPDSDDDKDEDDDFLDADPPPVVERITVPAGKPFQEIEEETSERPPDMLEEEEEYEKKQEELRREREQASHIWLKLIIGGALLAATFGFISRVVSPRELPQQEDNGSREETPVTDRRMTLIPEEQEPPKIVVPKKEARPPIAPEVSKQIHFKEISPRIIKQASDDEEPLDEPEDVEPKEDLDLEDEDLERYSDDEEEEVLDDEEPDVTKKVSEKLKATPIVQHAPDTEEEVPDDVEIIDDDIEYEEEEEDEEEISDVDDMELLSRLEAKYGRLPEPERYGYKPKDGGNSVEEWPGEPSDPFWRQQLESAERQLRQGKYMSAVDQASAPELSSSARARWIAATALDRAAEAERDNRILSRAVAAYLELLKLNELLSDKKLVEIASRTLDRIQFRGTYLSAEPVYRLLIRRFPDNISYRNNLTVAYLMANRADLAETLLKDTLLQWPNNRHALAHYGFVLKTLRNKHEEAVEMFEKALEGDTGPACEPRFYYHYGDALLLLSHFAEAHEVHKRAAKHGHFLSPAQRSLYNVPRLKGQPWWDIKDTPYIELAKALERNWREILKEGHAAKALYEQEKEGLKERGEWSQLDLFVRGREIPDRCNRAPVTCAVVKTELAAVTCRRGQIKFSSMEAGTHVRPHVGPTNCRLRMHLGLSNTKDTFIRVDQEIRQWHEGKVLLFDDSFEHEVWHNGTGTRLVLIVDVWHPELTPAERRQLPAI